MKKTILKNAKLFYDNDLIKADLAIAGETISQIGLNLKGDNEVDLTGCWVLPGAIDAHVHFSLPFAGRVSADDFFTGSCAAAAGGVTTFIDFTAQKNDEGLIEIVNNRISQAQPDAAIDYSLHACIKNFSKKVENDMPELCKSGINSLKIFMAYSKTKMMQNDAHLYQIMKSCVKNNITLLVHAENGTIIDNLEKCHKLDCIEDLSKTRPELTEVEAINRIGFLALQTGCRVYVVHVSSAAGAEEIRHAALRGAKITGETCPQYLYLDNSKLVSPEGHLYSCCPPIREKSNNIKLFVSLEQALKVVATDHCPFTKEDKNSWGNNLNNLPMGLPGTETMLLQTLNGYFSKKIKLKTAINSVTKNPAKIFGMYPQKGSLLPGTDADIVVFDPNATTTIDVKNLNMNTDYSPYQSMTFKGKVIMTFLRGKNIYSHSKGFIGKKGTGRFIKRKAPSEELFYG